MNQDTRFSQDRRHRFTLWRRWDETKPVCAFIGLNPSTADETQDDPTIRRCIDYAKSWGYGSLCMLNLFSLRATDPKVMKSSWCPNLPENDDAILDVVQGAGIVVCAWGSHGAHFDRAEELLAKLWSLPEPPWMHHLGLTATGHPKHPLYLKKDALLTPMERP